MTVEKMSELELTTAYPKLIRDLKDINSNRISKNIKILEIWNNKFKSHTSKIKVSLNNLNIKLG